MESNYLKLICFPLLFLISFHAFSYNEPDSSDKALSKNGISVQVASNIFWNTTSMFYERRFPRGYLTPLLRTGYEYFLGSGYYDMEVADNFTLQIGVLTGRKSHHLELGLAYNRSVFVPNRLYYYPLSGFLGYRYSKPGKMPFFQIGLGLPKGLQFGLGVNF